MTRHVLSLAMLGLVVSAAPPANTILIEDMGRAADQATRRPITISRIFTRGEVPACAKASVSGTPLDTQCDVKTRWPDGSLKHAILTFWLDLSPGAKVQVVFIAAPCAPPGGALAKQQILDYLSGAWGAVVEAIANVAPGAKATYAADVRAILAAWDGAESDLGVRYWLKGPQVTQIIVEDKSAALPYDFGWQSALPGVKTAATVLPTDQVVQVQAADVPKLTQWSFPLNAWLGSEKLRLCSVNGSTITICPGGRGVDGSRTGEQRVNWTMLPDAGWRDAPEDKYRSLHPLFVVTIYPGWAGVKVDAIMENVWATKLQDQAYTARVGRGPAGAETIWQWSILHAAQTRWRKTFWNGAEPPPLRVDHNLAYLVSTGALPSYDIALTPSATAIQNEKAHFARTGAEVGSFGQWDPLMPDPGGRGEIGLVPRWYLLYLYSGDYTLQRNLAANADASAYVPIHLRESLADGRTFVAGQTAPALGRPISIDARPTVVTRPDHYADAEVKPQDRIVPVGTVTTGGWYPDLAHQPAMAFVPYILTGDWYYLEELQFWSAWNLGYSLPTACAWCRNDSVGYIYGSTELRAEAWTLRNLAETAWASPDGTPEAAYFTAKLRNNIAVREGRYDIAGGSFYEPAPSCPAPCAQRMWRYGRDFDGRGLSNPLHFPMYGSAGLSETPLIDTTKAAASWIPWQGNYLHVALRHISDLGYVEIEPLRKTLASNLIQMLQHPDFNAFLAGEYLMPVRKLPDGYYTSWRDVLGSFGAAAQAEAAWPAGRLDYAYSYAYILNAAASTVTEITDPQAFSGAKGYQWINSRIKPALYADDPTWALVPRAAVSVQPPAPTATITWELVSGSLPPGLALSADGKLTGTPTSAGSYKFTLRAVVTLGSQRAEASQEFSLSVATPVPDPPPPPPISPLAVTIVSPAMLPGAVAGASYSYALIASVS